MDQHLFLWLAPPDGHEQNLQDDICRLTALHRPADHTPGIQVNDHCEVGKALMRLDVGDVCYPDFIWGLDMELPVEGIVDHDRRLATIAGGAALVADLRSDPRKLRQSGDPVRTDAFALVNQVIMQLAIALDLTALAPSLVQHFSLAPVFLRPCTHRSL